MTGDGRKTFSVFLSSWTAIPADGTRLGSFRANSIASPFPIEDTTSQVQDSCEASLVLKKLAPQLVRWHSTSTAIEDTQDSFRETLQPFAFLLTMDAAWRKLVCSNNFWCSASSFLAVWGNVTGRDNSLSIPPSLRDLVTWNNIFGCGFWRDELGKL